MAKPPKPGTCVHCLKFSEEMNWDHVFPKSWYPETSEKDEEKWTVPSCIPCNSKYGKIEKELLIRFGLCLDPEVPESKGVVERSMRSIDPASGKNEKDSQARAHKRLNILRQLVDHEAIAPESIYPNFGHTPETIEQQTGGVLIKKADLEAFCEKIVRGVFYIEKQRYVKPPYQVSVFALRDEDATDIIQEIKKYGKRVAREPGLRVLVAVSDEDDTSSLLVIEIWGKLKMYAAIQRENA